MRTMAFITDGPTARDILDLLGETITPPTVAPAPGTRDSGTCAMPERAVAIPAPSRHRSTNSTNASFGNPDRRLRATLAPCPSRNTRSRDNHGDAATPDPPDFP